MALQTSGKISISDIQTELGSSSGSLRSLSSDAGKAIPDAISEFYGYSAGSNWEVVSPGAGGWFRAIRFHPTNSDIVYMGGDRSGMDKSTDFGVTWNHISNGLVNHSIEDVAVHPTNGDIVICATNAGVHKTTDGGNNWSYKWGNIISTPKRLAIRDSSYNNELGFVSAVHICEDNPNYMFAGSGGHHPWYWNPSSPYFVNVYRSTDAGETWNIVTNGINQDQDCVICIFSDPNDASVVFVGTKDYLYKSTDYGASFSTVRYDGVWYGLVDPANSSNVYALDFISSGGQNVLKSTNGGSSFSSSSNGLPSDFIAEEIHIDGTTLYVGARNKVTSNVYKSTDGGANWTDIGITSSVDMGYIGSTVVTSFAVDGNKIMVCPAMTKTSNGGLTWEQTYTEEKTTDKWKSKGAEILVAWNIAHSPAGTSKKYCAVADEGITVSEDEGDSWDTDENTENFYTENEEWDVDYLDDIVYSGEKDWYIDSTSGWTTSSYLMTPDGKYYRISSVVSSTHLKTVTGADSDYTAGTKVVQAWKCNSGSFVEFEYDDSSVIYAAMENWYNNAGILIKSVDGGSSWTKTNYYYESNKIKFITTKLDGTILIFAGGRSVYKSTNGGSSWSQGNGAGWGGSGYIAIDRANESYMYLAVNNPQSGENGFYKSTDGGSNWTAKQTADLVNCSSVVVSGTTVYVTVRNSTKGGVWKSTDRGETFTKVLDISTDEDGYLVDKPDFRGLAMISASEVYAVTNDSLGINGTIWKGQGIYHTTDGGSNWDVVEGQYHNNVYHVSINNNKLYIATDGQGMKRLPL